MYSAKAIANFFLEKAKQCGQPLTQMKLQKLVYYAYGWYLALADSILIDERAEAWQYGPVFPTLYDEFKNFGARPITCEATDLDFSTLDLTVPKVSPTDGRTIEILSRVWRVYGELTAEQLSAMTHEPASPWTRTWAECQGVKGVDIPVDSIREYFQDKAKANRDAQQRTATA
jgi:uncharacterized phage-associated protein